MSATAPASPAAEAIECDAVQRALATSARPARPSPMSASLTFWWRAMLKIRHIPERLFDVTMYTGLTLNRDIQKGVHDRFRSLPIWRPATPVTPVTGVVMAVGLLLVFCFSLSWAWTMLGIVMRSEQALMGLSMMVLFPLTFVSNVFVPPETLPGWLEAFVEVNPITILVTAMRGLMHGQAVGSEILAVLVISAGLVAVLGPLTMLVYRRTS